MQINGKLGEYECSWVIDGYTWAIVKICQRKKFFFGRLSYYKNVSQGRIFGWPKHVMDCQTMMPHDARKWYQEAVKEYELYTEEWSKENLTTPD